jgi:hypothetical protein
MSLPGEELWQQAKDLNWLEEDASPEVLKQAIVLLRKATDEHNHFNAYHDIIEATGGVKYTPEELQDLLSPDDSSSNFLAGVLFTFGHGGVKWDEDKGWEHFKRATEKGHQYAHYCLYSAKNNIEDLQKALEFRLPDALYAMAKLYEEGSDDVAQDLFQAVLLHEQADQLGVWYSPGQLEVLRRFPLDIAPWGKWTPSYTKYFPKECSEAIYTWLLTGYRQGLPQEVLLLVCTFIATKSGWGTLIQHDPYPGEEEEETVVVSSFTLLS